MPRIPGLKEAARRTRRAIYLSAEKFSRAAKKASNEASCSFTPRSSQPPLGGFFFVVHFSICAQAFCRLRHLQMAAAARKRPLRTSSPAVGASFGSRRPRTHTQHARQLKAASWHVPGAPHLIVGRRAAQRRKDNQSIMRPTTRELNRRANTATMRIHRGLLSAAECLLGCARYPSILSSVPSALFLPLS